MSARVFPVTHQLAQIYFDKHCNGWRTWIQVPIPAGGHETGQDVFETKGEAQEWVFAQARRDYVLVLNGRLYEVGDF